MFLAAIFNLLLAAITLDGVTGANLSVAATLDANNVRIGDPLELTVRFYGSADFSTLHPPALSRSVDAAIWKVDDEGAKTDTDRNTRRLVYRVRPRKTGVLEFPALHFTYEDAAARKNATISTQPIPVHVRPGSQIALAELDDARAALPNPDGILVDLSASEWGSAKGLTDDALFAWRKACASPSAAAFAAFDFPEARLNEAACETMSGNWAKAVRIYTRLEWRIGQTAAIERGLVAALARKTGNPSEELPMWRQVMRPIWRFALLGRVTIVLGVLALAALILYIVRRGVRAIACAALMLATVSVLAAQKRTGGGFDPFEELERMRRQMDEQMQMMMSAPAFGGGGITRTFVNGQQVEEAKITASVRPDRSELVVGEEFRLILSLEMPKGCTVSELKFLPSQTLGYSVTGNGDMLTDGNASNTNNIIKRVSIPVRYDAPFAGRVTFSVGGMKAMRLTTHGGRGFSSFSSNFRVESEPIWMEVKPLSDENRPQDYTGAVGSAFTIRRRANPTRVATNDVVTIDYVMRYTGFLPPGAVPGGVVTGENEVCFRRYFVADGSPKTDDWAFPYYDVLAKDYRLAKADGVALTYIAQEEDAPKTVVVNAGEEKSAARLVRLRFAPRETAEEIAAIATDGAKASLTITERHGAWVRVDDGHHAGWVRKEELE